MAVTLTTNFSLRKLERFDDYQTEYGLNWDDIDTLLKDLNFVVGLNGRLVTADNTTYAHQAINSGTGFDYLSPNTSSFNNLDVNEIQNTGTITIAPSGTTGGGSVSTYAVVAGRTTLTVGTVFDIVTSVKEIRLNSLRLLESGLIESIEPIGGLEQLELRGGSPATSFVTIKPESDENERVTFKRNGDDGVILTGIGDTNSRLSFGIAASYFESLGSLFLGTNLSLKKLESSATHTAGAEIVLIEDTTLGSYSLFLPSLAAATFERIYFIKNAGGANTLTVDGDAGDTIDGAATVAVAAGKAIIILAASTEWVILSELG